MDVGPDGYSQGVLAMCLTFCHRRALVYNNHTCDVCEDCTHRLGGAGRCEQCIYYAGNDVCDLTKSRVPRWRRCCHWNVERDELFETEVLAPSEVAPMVPLDAVDPVLLAREYRDSIELFADEWGLGPEGIPVAKLAVPVVYGAMCSEWGEAVGMEAGPRWAEGMAITTGGTGR